MRNGRMMGKDKRVEAKGVRRCDCVAVVEGGCASTPHCAQRSGLKPMPPL